MFALRTVEPSHLRVYIHAFHLLESIYSQYSNWASFSAAFSNPPGRFFLFGETLGDADKEVMPS